MRAVRLTAYDLVANADALCWTVLTRGIAIASYRPVVRAYSIFESRIQDQKGLCAYCSEPFGTFENEANPTKDHVIPKSKGGGTHWGNFVIACARCNHSKGNLDEAEFRLIIAQGRLRARRKLVKPPGMQPSLPPHYITKRQFQRMQEAQARPIRTPIENPPRPKLKDVTGPYWNNPPPRDWDEDRYVTRTAVAAE